VAIVPTPIVAKYKRRITPKEAAKLQSFPNDFKIHKNDHIAYRQFGNSVNVKMVTLLANWLFNEFK
jgi:DNA (cytosine-5)-methyltransferase 1